AFQLDAIVTVVDARHIGLHLDRDVESVRQIAFADILLLNKTDLVTAEELHKVEHSLRHINSQARLFHTRQSSIDINQIVGVSAYDLDQKKDFAIEHTEPHVHEHHHDHDHVHGPDCDHDHDHEHHDHHHHSGVSSHSFRLEGEIDPAAFQTWMSIVLQQPEMEVYRSKGILNVKGQSQRIIFQGVHQLFDSAGDRLWKPGEDRSNQFVFIGRNLDTEKLEAGMQNALVKKVVKMAPVRKKIK
ncbi:MAG: GTP-binding protein, partial [Bacteroidetes bacterium]